LKIIHCCGATVEKTALSTDTGKTARQAWPPDTRKNECNENIPTSMDVKTVQSKVRRNSGPGTYSNKPSEVANTSFNTLFYMVFLLHQGKAVTARGWGVFLVNLTNIFQKVILLFILITNFHG